MQYITYRKLAEKLTLSEASLRQRIRRNPEEYPPVIKLGPRSVRFDLDTVDRWLRAKNARGEKLYA